MGILLPLMLHGADKARMRGWICLLLALTTLGVYSRVFTFGFLNYDDDLYVEKNPHVLGGASWNGVRWAFTARDASNWHPLTWVSHMLDCSIFGLNPCGHHATSLLLHILNSVLLFLVLQHMSRAQWRSALVAALFALHPLHVESVAWVAERKDVLSTFFGILTFWAYAVYAEKPRLPRYLLVLGLFALGLMAKPTLVTLPFLLLLLDFWPLNRVPGIRCQVSAVGGQVDPQSTVHHPLPALWRLILEKLPLLALSAVSCVVTLWAQAPSLASTASIALHSRLSNAVVSYFRYLVKTAWPVRLYVNYPYPPGWPTWYVVTASLLVGCLSVIAVRAAKKRPYVFTGWFWFMGTLVPVIGLVQVGIQSMADRYTYVPLIGLFIVVAWGGYDLARKCQLRPAAFWSMPLLVIAACVPLTIKQVGYWRNNFTLFEHALRLNPNNFFAENNLAISYVNRGELEPALEHFIKSAKLNPHFGKIYSNIGQVQISLGRYEEAVEPFRTALRCDPKLASAHYGLAVTLEKEGNRAQAIQHLVTAIELAPDLWEAHDELGVLLQKEGKNEKALDHLFQAARLKPGSAVVRSHLAAALDQSGRATEAAAQYREALNLNPDMPGVLNNLAWMLATHPDPAVRNGTEAVRLAEHACQLTHYQAPLPVGTLAATYAEAGRFEEAIATARKAEALAAAEGKQELAAKNRKLAELFGRHQAFHELQDATSPAQDRPSTGGSHP